VKTWFRPAGGTNGLRYFKYKDPDECWASVDMRFRGQFTTKFDLKKFPFDEQHLTIIIMANEAFYSKNADDKVQESMRQYASQRCVLQPASRKAVVCETALSDIWDVHRIVKRTAATSKFEDSSSGTVYPMMLAEIKVTRKASFYLWETIFILFVVGSMSTTVWFLPADNLPDRIKIVIAGVLIVVTNRFSVMDYLPDIGYLTRLDRYGIFVILMLSAIAVENVVAFLLDKQNPRETVSQLLESVFTAAWTVIWVVAHLLILLGIRQEAVPSGVLANGIGFILGKSAPVLKAKQVERTNSTKKVPQGQQNFERYRNENLDASLNRRSRHQANALTLKHLH